MITLRVDPEFQMLIPVLSAEEFELLENNMLRDGCRDPICVWEDIILDGHNRYAICTKYNMKFTVQNIEITTRHEAMAWICANQLGRRNITEETRKYLIGKRYQSEKMSKPEINLFRRKNPPMPTLYDSVHEQQNRVERRTSVMLGNIYHISHATVEKYGRYAEAIDQLVAKSEEPTPQVLSGQYKLSQGRTIEISTLTAPAVKKVFKEIRGKRHKDAKRYFETPKYVEIVRRQTDANVKTVKDMPEYDPDSEVSILTLTLPSWRDIMLRVLDSLLTKPVTNTAKIKLASEIQTLFEPITQIIRATVEGTHGTHH